MLKIFFCVGMLFLAKNALAADCESPVNQMEINRCASSELDAETSAMNSVFGKYRDMLDVSEKQRLDEVGVAWAKYKDMACNFEASAVQGGSMQPYVLAQCLVGYTKIRRKQLEALLRCDSGVTPGCL